jgi:hypothetical protein
MKEFLVALSCIIICLISANNDDIKFKELSKK